MTLMVTVYVMSLQTSSCTDGSACNYIVDAEDDSSCTYPELTALPGNGPAWDYSSQNMQKAHQTTSI